MYLFRITRVAVAALLLTSILAIVLFLLSISTPKATSAASRVESESPSELASALAAAGLPIATVKAFPATDATGTVIYIPQSHRIPGSSPADPANDNAVETQNQIASIVRYLTTDLGTKYVMAEGDMYGPVSSDKLGIITEKMSAAHALSSAADALQKSCANAPACTKAETDAEYTAQALNREVSLAGGAHDVKAAGGTFALYGAEDQSVQDQSGNIVRDYVYLNDRLSQLGATPIAAMPNPGVSGSISGTAASPVAEQNPLAQLVALMQGQTRPSVLSENDIQALEQFGSSNNDSAVTYEANSLEHALSLANSAEADSQAADAAASQGLPSRSQNPYGTVTDVNQLQHQLMTTVNDMQNTIVDERNEISSKNFMHGLAATQTNTGVLIYGAGHTAGLLSDLKSEGLNVIVVVPQSLANDQELSSALAS